MKYMALLKIVDAALNQTHRPAHLAYIDELFHTGKVVQAGPFADGWGGMVIYECESPEEADRLAHADPVVVHGARTVDVHPWKPLDFPLNS